MISREAVAEQYRDASNLSAWIELHQRFSVNPRGLPGWIFDHLQLGANARIVELGCGRGDLWVENQPRIPPDWDITLTDFSPGMVTEARRRLERLARSFRLLVCDGQAIPFGSERFDAIIANFMLFHVPDRENALSEIRRVLRPGGHLYAATNGRRHLQELNELVGRFAPGMLPQRGVFSLGFSLENGAEQLRAAFPLVQCHRFDDALEVTEVEPLLAYVRSGASSQSLEAGGLQELAAFVRAEIERQGAFRIAKDSGLFEAW